MNNEKNKENQKEKIEIIVREDGVLEFKVTGILNEQLTKKMEEKVLEEFEIAKKLPGKVKVLADMKDLSVDKKTGWMSTLDLRKLGVRFLKWDKLEKIAILGNPKDSFLKVAISFVLKLVDIKKIKHFIKKEEAEKWLKQ
jgi:hypothetical protein